MGPRVLSLIAALVVVVAAVLFPLSPWTGARPHSFPVHVQATGAVFDARSSTPGLSCAGNPQPGPTLTWTHTTATAENAMLVVLVASIDPVLAHYTVQYRGLTATAITATGNEAGQSQYQVSFWIPSPPAGSATVYVNTSSNVLWSGIAYTFYNVQAAAPHAQTENAFGGTSFYLNYSVAVQAGDVILSGGQLAGSAAPPPSFPLLAGGVNTTNTWRSGCSTGSEAWTASLTFPPSYQPQNVPLSWRAGGSAPVLDVQDLVIPAVPLPPGTCDPSTDPTCGVGGGPGPREIHACPTVACRIQDAANVTVHVVQVVGLWGWILLVLVIVSILVLFQNRKRLRKRMRFP